MPYKWTDTTQGGKEVQLQLWPHRSLPRRGFAGFVLATFLMVLLPLLAVLGTPLLWGLLPFVLLAVFGVWWGLEQSYRSGQMSETLTISPDQIHLQRTNPGGGTQDWQCNTYWAKAYIHAADGPVPQYVTLKGNGREVEIGAFLSEDERKRLFGDLTAALRRARECGGAS